MERWNLTPFQWDELYDRGVYIACRGKREQIGVSVEDNRQDSRPVCDFPTPSLKYLWRTALGRKRRFIASTRTPLKRGVDLGQLGSVFGGLHSLLLISHEPEAILLRFVSTPSSSRTCFGMQERRTGTMRRWVPTRLCCARLLNSTKDCPHKFSLDVAKVFASGDGTKLLGA